MGISEEIKSTKFESNKAKAMVNLLYTHNWFRDLHKAIMKKYGLQNQHYNVLRIVNGKYPDPVTPGYIKEVMLDKSPDVTRLVDKLVAMELVTRCPKRDNRRVMEIKMSDKGRELMPKLNEEVRQVTNHTFNLSEEEAETLSTLLDKARQGRH